MICHLCTGLSTGKTSLQNKKLLFLPIFWWLWRGFSEIRFFVWQERQLVPTVFPEFKPAIFCISDVTTFACNFYWYCLIANANAVLFQTTFFKEVFFNPEGK